MASEQSPSEWSPAKKIEVLVDLGVASPREFVQALLHIVDPDKATVLRLGHWPRGRHTKPTPKTVYAIQLTKLLLAFSNTYAPAKKVTAILIEQRLTPTHRLLNTHCALRIQESELSIGVVREGHWRTVVRSAIPTTNRQVVAYMGNNHTHRLRPHDRMQLRRCGFMVS